MLGAGMTMAVTVALLSYGGYLLDRELGTLPLFLVVGVLLGAVGGFVHLLMVVAPEALPFGGKKNPPHEPREPRDSDPESTSRHDPSDVP